MTGRTQSAYEPDGSLNMDQVQSYDIDYMRSVAPHTRRQPSIPYHERRYLAQLIRVDDTMNPDKQAEAMTLLQKLLAAKDRPGDGSRRRFDGASAYEQQAGGAGIWTELNGGPSGDPSYQLNLEPPTHAGLWLMDEVDEEGNATDSDWRRVVR